MFRGRVIYYHHVASAPRPEHWFFRNAATLQKLCADMDYLGTHYELVSVERLAECWERGVACPPRSVAVTFDDGLQSNYEAARLLHELSIPACFFVTTATIDTDFVPWNLRFAHVLSTARASGIEFDGRRVPRNGSVARRRWEHDLRSNAALMPPDRRDAELKRLAGALDADYATCHDADVRFLTTEQLRQMRRWGMTVGCHGATHEMLTRCNPDELMDEIVRSKERLAEVLEAPVEFFAYPDGVYNRAACDLASEHYRMAFTAPSVVGSRDDRWCYPRHGVDAVPIQRAMSWWFPWRVGAARAAKKALGYT